MEIPNKLFVNIMLDWKKNKIDKKAKAKLIKEYREKNKLSQRKLGELLDIPHSTIQDWEQYANIGNNQTREMKSAGYTDTEIYREVRKNRKFNCDGKVKPTLDKELSKMTYQIQQISKNFSKLKISSDTEYIIIKMRDMMNKLLMMIDRIEKK